MNERLGLDHLRKMEAADIQIGEGAAFDFARDVEDSVLPLMLRDAARAGLTICFVRVQRRPTANRPPAQSPALRRYVDELRIVRDDARRALSRRHRRSGADDRHVRRRRSPGAPRPPALHREPLQPAASALPVIFHSLDFVAFFVVVHRDLLDAAAPRPEPAALCRQLLLLRLRPPVVPDPDRDLDRHRLLRRARHGGVARAIAAASSG